MFILIVLFYGSAIYHTTRGDIANLALSFAIGSALLLLYILRKKTISDSDDFTLWLYAHKKKLLKGQSVKFKENIITRDSIITKYQFCYSYIIRTVTKESRYYFSEHENTFGMRTVCSLVTILFGWWGIPYGPFTSIKSLFINAKGGTKTKIIDLINKINSEIEKEKNNPEILSLLPPPNPIKDQLESLIYTNEFTKIQSLFDEQTSWTDKSNFVVTLSEMIDSSYLETWLKQEPKSALGYLVQGAYLIDRGWKIRGGAIAAYVKDEDAMSFIEYLDNAKQVLQKSIALDPSSPLGYTHMIPTIIGTGYAIEDEESDTIASARQYYDKAVAIEPDLLLVHRYMLMLLMEKWHGSNDQMFAFAREVVQKSKEGSIAPMILIEANLEYWYQLRSEEDDDNMFYPSGKFINNKEVITESLEAYKKSIGSPLHQESRSTLLARNLAAGWFHLTDQKDIAQHQFIKIGNTFVERPWNYFFSISSNPKKAFLGVKKKYVK